MHRWLSTVEIEKIHNETKGESAHYSLTAEQERKSVDGELNTNVSGNLNRKKKKKQSKMKGPGADDAHSTRKSESEKEIDKTSEGDETDDLIVLAVQNNDLLGLQKLYTQE